MAQASRPAIPDQVRIGPDQVNRSNSLMSFACKSPRHQVPLLYPLDYNNTQQLLAMRLVPQSFHSGERTQKNYYTILHRTATTVLI